MSLSLVLSNALSGLRATTKQADIVSNNVSNALTEGYARRDVATSAASVDGVGAGVRVEGVVRAANPAATEARRLSEAELGAATEMSDALARLADAVGDPGEPGGLATEADDLLAALSQASDTPESAPLLSGAVSAARDYVTTINRIANEVVALRTEADASIARQVSQINDSLNKIQSLNMEITARSLAGADISSLEDQRERLIKSITAQIPVKTYPRPNDEIAIYTKNGGQLLDGSVFPLGFDATPVVTPDRTLAGGGLSGLTANDRVVAIGTGAGSGLFDGGSLAAAFELRDRTLTELGDTLDEVAADLVLRTQGLAEDGTLAPGDPGLFTDAGAAFTPGDETGLALRLGLNALVDEDQGGQATRLRDGLNAAAPGEVGDATVLRGLRDALEALVPAGGAGMLTGNRDISGFAAEFSSAALTQSAAQDEETAFRLGRTDQLRDAELESIGVDTDQELSRLLVIEQNFNANARVIQVVDELLARLMQL